MNTRYPLSFVASLLVVGCYLVFTALALAAYPSSYSPWSNWLSDLGNPEVSPGGAVFYNLGLAITAGLVFVFFLGLVRFRLVNHRAQTAMIILTVLFGSLGALAMLMTTLFPIHLPQPHSFWSAVNRCCIGTGFAFSIAAFRYYRRYPRWLLGFGAIVVLVDLCASAFFTEVFILEWVTIGLWLAYCGLLGAATRRLDHEPRPEARPGAIKVLG